MPANFGITPSSGTSTFGGPLTDTGISSKWIEENRKLIKEQRELQREGREVTFARIMRGRGLSDVQPESAPVLGPQLPTSGPGTGTPLDITKPIFSTAPDVAAEWARNAKEVRDQMAEIEAISQKIADLQAADASKQQAMQQEQYNEQLRISVRSAGDALGLAGQTAATYRKAYDYLDDGTAAWRDQNVEATKYGRMQRAQMMDQRELAKISIARNQREINMQLALARLRSPGETAAERAVRRREAEALAKEQQQVQDINKRSTTRGFRIQDIELSRNAKDVLKQLELMTGQHALQIDLQGSQAQQRFLQRTLAVKESILGVGDALGEQIDKIVMGAWSQLESATGEWRDVFTEETGTLMDITFKAAKTRYTDFLRWLEKKNENLDSGGSTGSPHGPNKSRRTGYPGGETITETVAPVGGGGTSSSGGTTDTNNKSGLTRTQVENYIKQFIAMGQGKEEIRQSMLAYGVSIARTNHVGSQMAEAGDIPKWAAGGVFSANQATSFIAGEAGPESVVVIRNPKVGMTSGGMAPGGGGRATINININASVRNDHDVDALVRKVVREIHSQSELVV